MTIEEFYQDKKASASEVCSSDTDKAKTEGCPVIGEYITIPTLMYMGLVRDSELLACVIRILTDKRIGNYRLSETLAAILDLPYEEGGES